MNTQISHCTAPEPAKSSSNFHLAFLFLPKDKRQAMADFYEFCRYADDIVDEVENDRKSIAQENLDALKNEVGNAFEGKPMTLLGEKIARLSRQYPVHREDFLKIIEGCQKDLQCSQYATFADLYEYCYCVAAAVGLVSIEIFGYRSPATREYAVNLGVAFQLTNILRDIREDSQRGRIYLPLEDLRRFGYSEAMLQSGQPGRAFERLMAFECERALNYYRKADEKLAEVDRANLVAAEIMKSVYFKILKTIEKNPSEVLRHRIQIGKTRKMILALSAYFQSLTKWRM